MLQNMGNCVGFISEIWEIKPPLCTSLNPKFLHNHLLWVPSLPPTSFPGPKQNKKTLPKTSSKPKQASFLI